MHLISFFNLRYLFDFHPLPINPLPKWILLIIFSLLFIAGIILKFLPKKKDLIVKKAFKKIANCSLTMGLLGWLLLLFRLGGIYFLSARFFLIFWLIGTIFWGVSIIKYLVKVYPQEKRKLEKQRELKKYLP